MRGMCDISLACGLDAYAGLNAPPRFAGFHAQKACVCLFQLQRTKDITMQHPQDYGLIERLRRSPLFLVRGETGRREVGQFFFPKESKPAVLCGFPPA